MFLLRKNKTIKTNSFLRSSKSQLKPSFHLWKNLIMTVMSSDTKLWKTMKKILKNKSNKKRVVLLEMKT